MKEGKVYLVGAGPGDPDLISVKGLKCLKQADVILYDRLIDEHLLDIVPAKAKRIYVGKASHGHTKSQHEINQLLLTTAKERKTVVRLKGGDPFVLGRGSEEAKTLALEHIPFEIVPGITSAVAVPAYAGIPVTHRGLASSFAVITGHEDPNKGSSSINWKMLATGVDTLVFLMGLKNLPEIVAKLVDHGRSYDTPVAVIKDGTKPEQITIIGRLGDIVAKVKENALIPPVVIVVGQVVELREKLRWFDNQPLFGKRILVTRSRRQASVLSELLSQHGARPIELPTIEIQSADNYKELDQAILDSKYYQWIIFTSLNSVEYFFQRLHSLNLDARALSNIKVGAIGKATSKSLETKGIIPDFVPDIFTSRELIAGLASKNVSGQCFLLPRTDIADKELTEGIRRLGAKVHEVIAYRTVPATETISQAVEKLLSDRIDVITFTSSATVSNLVSALEVGELKLNSIKVACIGPKTAASVITAGLNVDIIAREHTIPGLVTAIEEYFKKEC